VIRSLPSDPTGSDERLPVYTRGPSFKGQVGADWLAAPIDRLRGGAPKQGVRSPTWPSRGGTGLGSHSRALLDATPLRASRRLCLRSRTGHVGVFTHGDRVMSNKPSATAFPTVDGDERELRGLVPTASQWKGDGGRE
jgi:hypothetical protein